MSELSPLEKIEPDQYDSLQISDKVREILTTGSQKHYKSSNDYNLGAILYFAQNQVEKVAVEKQFPNSIFITYSGSDLNDIFPDLPTFYMYSTQKGVSSKPWFI
jgi:hypothetical protein